MKRPSFLEEERKEAVRRWLYSDLSQAEVASEVGVKTQTIGAWVHRYRRIIKDEDDLKQTA